MKVLGKKAIWVLMLAATAVVGQNRIPKPVLQMQGHPLKDMRTTVQAGTPTYFMASNSTDPDGDPLTYFWDFDDGTTSTEMNPIHTFTQGKVHMVRLTVDDGRGDTPGLLTGMTPQDLVVPNGWTLERAQDFEGELDKKWYMRDRTSVTSERANSGLNSVGGEYAGDVHDVGVMYMGLDANEVYASWYEYWEEQAVFNEEILVLQWYNNDGVGWQEILAIWRNCGGAEYNSKCAGINYQPQGTDGYGITANHVSIAMEPPLGRWYQHEVHIIPGTNGIYKHYVDGKLQIDFKGNVSGDVNMRGGEFRFGGVYTKHIWWKDGCGRSEIGEFITDGSAMYCDAEGHDTTHRCPDFLTCPAPAGPLEPFKRFFDDIVILKR